MCVQENNTVVNSADSQCSVDLTHHRETHRETRHQFIITDFDKNNTVWTLVVIRHSVLQHKPNSVF